MERTRTCSNYESLSARTNAFEDAMEKTEFDSTIGYGRSKD